MGCVDSDITTPPDRVDVSEPVVVPGGRDVRGRLDSSGADAVVVACPPHPRHGGSRTDPRLRAVSDALAPEVACLRVDYGPWDDARGPALCTTDAENAVGWARGRFDGVGLFGYSFGGGVALRAASTGVGGCSVLAPTADPDALGSPDCPLQVVVGECDTTVDWAPVTQWARERGHEVVSLPADHGFAGQFDSVGRTVGQFFRDRS